TGAPDQQLSDKARPNGHSPSAREPGISVPNDPGAPPERDINLPGDPDTRRIPALNRTGFPGGRFV
ncbi:MAG: hypothetical protein AAFX62_18840, partial [Pseudomonadota bacterium]